MSFEAFFAQNKIKRENIRFVASQGFKDKATGEYLLWEIKAISNEEDDALRRACTKQIKVPGKANMYRPEIDFAQYSGKLAAACTVYPDLNDKELQDSYGVMGADNLLKAMLSPGEYTAYFQKVSEVNGFEEDANDLVKEAKN